MQVKEMLAELAMVESEIARLEIQITQLRKDLKIEQQHTTKSKQWSSEQQPQTNNNNKPPLNWNPISKTTFDTKALHFISKAIKGDYALNHHFKLDNSKNNELDPRDAKDSHHPLHEVKLHERSVSRKSGLLVASSPLRDPRHPSPKVYTLHFVLFDSVFQVLHIIHFLLWLFHLSFPLFISSIFEILY